VKNFRQGAEVSKVFSKLVLTVFAMVFSPVASHASMTSVYIGQTAAGAGDGTSCANEYAVSFFNSGGNWGSGSTQIGPGTTVYVCGTITTALTVQGNGASGNPVLIQWESGASVQVCSTTGAVQIEGNSYITLDLGANATAVECPNNGIGLSTAQDSVIGIGSGGNGWNNVEIRNGTVGPVFVYRGGTDNGFKTICINGASGANNTYIHNAAIAGCAEGIEIDPTANSTDQFSYMTVDRSVGRVLNYASGSASNIALANSSFHDNSIDYSSVWAVGGDYEHYEAIHIYNTGNSGSRDHISNFQIYNNYFYGASPTNHGSTALIFMGEGGSSCVAASYSEAKMFNNVIVDSGTSRSGFSSGTGGYFYMQDCEQTMSLYNNTINVGVTSNACFRFLETAGTTGNTWNVENNICEGGTWAYYFDALPKMNLSNNDYYKIGSRGWEIGSTNYAFARWKRATGQDANSITTNPGLNANYTIASASSAAYQVGANLTSLGVTPLEISAPLNFGESGSCGSGCVARPSSGNWDLGAYPYQAATNSARSRGGMFAERK
jgi:hypothetical protein